MIKTYVTDKMRLLSNRVDTLSFRERLLVMITVLVATFVLWESLVVGIFFPSDEEVLKASHAIEESIKQLQDQITGVSQAISGTNELIKNNEALKQENQILKQRITEQTNKMISPKDMLSIVKNLINASNNLIVLELKNSDPVDLFPEKGQKAIMSVYLHTVNLKLRGKYFDVMNFLRDLEAKNMKMIWSSLEYTVQEYPMAEVTIVLQTLGLEAGWIGV